MINQTLLYTYTQGIANKVSVLHICLDIWYQ